MTDTAKQPLVITFSGEMPQKRQMVFQMGVDADTDIAAIHALLDKARVAFERQFAFGEIEIHRLELEQQMKLAKDHSARIMQVEENIYRDMQGRRVGPNGEQKLSQKQEAEKAVAYQTAESIKERIALIKGRIADCDAKIAG